MKPRTGIYGQGYSVDEGLRDIKSIYMLTRATQREPSSKKRVFKNDYAMGMANWMPWMSGCGVITTTYTSLTLQ